MPNNTEGNLQEPPTYLIAGNWKMNLKRDDVLAFATDLNTRLENMPACEVLLCAPSIYLSTLSEAVDESVIQVGAQTCHSEISGAHTGHTAAEMVADIGANYVIVGHSERRQNDGETSAIVAAQSDAALRAEITPIICIGEPLDVRESNDHIDYVLNQLDASLGKNVLATNCVIAYEPVWAIGTGKTAGAAEISEMHDALRDWLMKRFGDSGAETRLLYGGSVKPVNAAEIFHVENVNGALIGGASLKVDDFYGIIEAVPAL